MKNFTLLLLLAFSFPLYPQKSDDVLAKIGDKIITVEEFKARYELTPQINRKYYDEVKAREELLYTLIAENLFAIEAERMGLDTVKAMKMNYVPLEKMFVRDALYKNEIADSVELNFSKFKQGLELADYKCFVDYVFAEDKQSIENAYQLLKSNDNFDSLVTLIKDAEYVSEPYEVDYGKMYEHAEEAIFSLQINDFTEPVESPEGWYIFRLISKLPINYKYKSLEEKHSLVRKVVEGRQEDSIYNEFWNDFFKEKKITTDGSLFWYFAEELHKVVLKIKDDNNIKDNEKIMISNEDFSFLLSQLSPDSLNKTFIKLEENPLTLGSFLNDFIFEGFFTFSTDLNVIASQLNSRVKRQIELELLTKNAYSKGMEKIPEVKTFTDIWKRHYLSTLLKKEVYLSTDLTDKDIQDFFNKQNSDSLNQSEYNIIEVLTDDLQVIREALNISENTSEFKKFAKNNSKRQRTKENEGEFGYFTASEFKEIGEVVESMNIGDVYGPLETSDGYSLFKLIDKKVNYVKVDDSYIDENVKMNIRYEKIIDQLEDLAVDLADKYGLETNNELLNSLELLNAQMIVFRYMGFGGRIQAFPYSSPFYKWKEKLEQKKKEAL